MKKLLLVPLFVFLVVLLSPSALAIIITPDIQFVVGNETYNVNDTMVFSQIIIDSTYIVFNTTGFYVLSPDITTITLVYISDTIVGATNGEKVLDFYAITTSGQATFNIGGFEPTVTYQVRQEGSPRDNTTSDSLGYIRFENNVWSEQHFEGYRYGKYREYYFEGG